MEIKVGDRITYTFDEMIRVEIATDKKNIENILEAMEKGENYKILKIERPQWEVVEEKKKLLTEEERDYLKLYMKINDIKAKKIKFNIATIEFFKSENVSITTYLNTENSFKGIEFSKKYTLSELGLEE